MEDLLLGLLYAIAEGLFEAFLSIVGEAVVALISRKMGEAFAGSRAIHPILAGLGYLSLGGAAGLLSLLLFPHRLVPQSRIHGASLVVSPLLAGFVMSQAGRSLRQRGQQPIRIESFGYAFVFAFGMALIRFIFVR